ncbi:MAG: S1 RNA-binding domain-containing protein, partial [Bacteroidales bacterium]|nr:S1 RNA-binding domain-containing protein [Bacteroidales bacterium]
PESYHIVEKMAKDKKVNVNQLIEDKEIRASVDVNYYVSENVGLPTLNDIMQELEKPGLDPRQKVKVLEFAANIFSIDDLEEGMELPGIITNITNFGAFVDIGIKQNGLIHISNMANRFIKDPNEVVKLHEHVKVRVIGIDLQKGRIQLSLK